MTLQFHLEDRATSDRQRLASKRDSMSVDEAISTLSDKPEVMALVQEGLIHSVERSSSMRHLRHHNHQAPVAPSTAGERAKVFLNKMIEEAGDKLDLEQIRCSAFEAKYKKLMETSTQTIASYNAQSAAARAAMMKAQTLITMISFRITTIQTSLEESIKECTSQSLAFAGQLTIISDDLEVMDRLANASSCADATGTSLLQCDDDDGDSFIGFGHHVVRRGVMQLKSDYLRQEVREMLRDSEPGAGKKMKHTEFAELTAQDASSFVQLEESEDSEDEDTVMPLSKERTSMTPAQFAKARAKCSFNKNPQCQQMNDKFVLMQSEVMDKKQDLEDTISTHNKNCKASQDNFQSQISNLEGRLKDQQAALAEATEAQNNADEQSRLETFELQKLDAEFRKGMHECSTNIGGSEQEKCSLEKLRLEVFNTGGATVSPPIITDCAVSSWIADDCDAKCGGGKQKLTRTITIQPDGGAACPVLAMERSCNEDECPVDCKLQMWSGWSTCSAPCGGGVKERSRIIDQQAMHGGTQCGATSETQACGTNACNEECKLGEWSSWGVCSQQCDGGVKQRQKPVAVAAVGNGACPDSTDPMRQEFEECNTVACIKPTSFPTYRCKAKLDVILLLDGSGSLRQRGWDASVKAASMFAEAMTGGEDDIKLATLLFSGPSRRNMRKCTGRGYGGRGRRRRRSGKPNMAKDCKISWVSRFSADTKAQATKIKALKWPRSTTFTSGALSMAQAELTYGRKDAQSIVIVITDGRPMNRRATSQASKSLRKKARLMWVPVTRYAPLRDIRRWATRPYRDNIISVGDFGTLQRPDTISKIIVDMCPKAY
jgi:hypothetical protein